MCKSISFPLGIRPIYIVSHFMIDDIDPSTFGIILSPSFPIFRMYEVDTSIFVGFPCSFSPVKIFIPLYLRLPQAIKLTQTGYRSAKIQRATVLEKTREVSVYYSALLNRRKNHAHKISLIRKIIRNARQEEAGVYTRIVIIKTRV